MFKKLLSFEFIKDNISLILLVPTALGGFWQIIELAYVGVPYIRFFSISQLVADGLMMMFVIAISYFVIHISLAESSKNDQPTETVAEPAETNLEVESKTSIIKRLVFNLLVFGSFVFFYCKSLYDKISARDRLSTLEICLALFGVIILFMLGSIVLRNLSHLIDFKKLAQSKFRKWAMVFITPAIFYCVGESLFFLIPRLHNSYLIPENFKNNDYVACRIKQLNPSLKSFKIAYFNDKYIFIDVQLPKNVTKTEVLKFDDFFSGPCQAPHSTDKVSE